MDVQILDDSMLSNALGRVGAAIDLPKSLLQ
jgi:hypothetical protein